MSQRKAFLESKKFSSYHLSNQDDLFPIASYYQNKFKIKIYISGSSEIDPSLYEERAMNLRSFCQQYKNLADLCLSRWDKPLLNLNFKTEIKQQLKDAGYLDEKGRLRKIEPNEIEKFEKEIIFILKQIGKYKEAIAFLKAVNESARDYFREHEPEGIPPVRFRLLPIEYPAEIRWLQSRLKDDEFVGYIMPNDSGSPAPDRSHLVVMLISKNVVIKPINWIVRSFYEISKTDLPQMHTTTFDLSGLSPLDKDCGEFLKKQLNPTGLVIPQIGNAECGTLGILYLKELLKENANQLKQFTLTFSYYVNNFANESKPHKINFFIPSPQVLRYSQSKLYNLVIWHMLQTDDDQAIFEFNHHTVKVKSLRKILLDSIDIAKKINDVTSVNENLKILDSLLDFRKKWLAAYDLAMAKRESMQDIKNGNIYLAYKTRRLEQIKYLSEEDLETTDMRETNSTAIIWKSLESEKQSAKEALETKPLITPEEIKPKNFPDKMPIMMTDDQDQKPECQQLASLKF